jgi:phosphoribosylanthranilate isomerase
MNKIKLKVCGMREPENIRDVAALAPDFMGFIFYAKSPRYVGEDFTLPKNLSNEVKRVGVFVNEDAVEIIKKAEALNLDYVQLHGTESVQECEKLKKNNIGVIKVFSVDDQFDFETTKAYESVVDFFLFDTKGKYYGGNAKTFNWNLLKKYGQRVPFFLSGGLSPENSEEGLQSLAGMNLYALDINSGVETSPAVKDINKIVTIKDLLTKKL